MTLRELFDKYKKHYIDLRLKPNTVRGYLVNINNHILPVLGDMDIAFIDTDTIDDFVLQLKNKGLNNTTCIYCLSVLRSAFAFAVKRQYLTFNIFRNYDFPRKDNYSYKLLDESQLLSLYHYLENDDIFPCVLLAGFYGLRKGEILGLVKSDLYFVTDTKQYILTINRSVCDVCGVREVATPKNKSSVRSLLLTAEHSKRLKQYIDNRPLANSDYICSDINGMYINSNQLYYRFKLALCALNLPSIRFHDLRHSYATLMLKNGVHPKIISSVLGHSDVSTTLDIYSHNDVSMQIACLSVLDNLE